MIPFVWEIEIIRVSFPTGTMIERCYHQTFFSLVKNFDVVGPNYYYYTLVVDERFSWLFFPACGIIHPQTTFG